MSRAGIIPVSARSFLRRDRVRLSLPITSLGPGGVVPKWVPGFDGTIHRHRSGETPVGCARSLPAKEGRRQARGGRVAAGPIFGRRSPRGSFAAEFFDGLEMIAAVHSIARVPLIALS